MQDLILSSGKEIVIGVLSALGALFIFLLKNFFSERKKRLKAAEVKIEKVKENLDKKIEEITCLIVAIKEDVHKYHDSLKDKINEAEKQHIKDFGEMRGQVNVMANSLNSYSENVAKLTGRVDDQLDITASHINTISHMSRQLEALFKVVDAKKRASDCQDPN